MNSTNSSIFHNNSSKERDETNLDVDYTKVPEAKELKHTYNEQPSKRRKQEVKDFNELPDDIILKIFSFLPNSSLIQCYQVCLLWKKLSSSPIFWKHVVVERVTTTFNEICDCIQLETERLSVTRCRIDSGYRKPFRKVNETDCSRFRNLKWLTIENCAINLTCSFRYLTEYLFDLEYVSISQTECGNFFLKNLTRNQNLKELHMKWVTWETEEGNSKPIIEKLFSSLPKLDVLNFCCLDSIFTEHLMAHVSCFPQKITRLYLDYVFSNCDYSDAFRRLMKNCHNIRYLSLVYCIKLPCSSVNDIVDNLPKLSSLNIYRGEENLFGRLHLLKKLEHFTELQGNFQEFDLENLQQHLPNVNIIEPREN